MKLLNSIQSIDGFTVGQLYYIADGYYRHKKVKLLYIARYRQLCVDGKRFRQVHCLLIDNNQRINIQLNHLVNKITVVKKEKKDLSNISNKNIIKLAKLGNKNARQEFVRRFKKLPKISR